MFLAKLIRQASSTLFPENKATLVFDPSNVCVYGIAGDVSNCHKLTILRPIHRLAMVSPV